MSDVIQIYRVHSLTTDEGDLDFSGWQAQLIQMQKTGAVLLVQDPQNPLSGLFDVHQWIAESGMDVPLVEVYHLREITYNISAFLITEPEVIHSQDYRHEFRSCTLNPEWCMGTRRGTPLFTGMPLNSLLDTNKFPNVIGSQFVS